MRAGAALLLWLAILLLEVRRWLLADDFASVVLPLFLGSLALRVFLPKLVRTTCRFTLRALLALPTR